MLSISITLIQMFCNRTILLPNLYSLYNVLSNHTIDLPKQRFYYGNRIAINHTTHASSSMNAVRIWQTKSLCDYWYDELSSRRFIGALDYTIEKDHIKIDYISSNDGEGSTYNYDVILDNIEASNLYNSFICYVKSVAQEHNKPKIVLDVHSNLRLYEKYFKQAGFQLTDRKCSDNPYWVETEIVLTLNKE